MTFRFDHSTKPRTMPLDLVTIHWTAGIGGPERVARTLESRGLSVHYTIGVDGEVVQMASHDRRCAHASGINDRSIGIEVVSPGLPGPIRDKERVHGIVRAEYVDHVRGRRVTMLDFTAEQTSALTALVDSLCRDLGVPRVVPLEANGALARRRLELVELAKFRGVLGHYHAHPTKLDCGTRPLERLRVKWAA